MRIRPGRRRASRPSMPYSVKRLSHRRTVCSCVPSSQAMFGSLRPSLANRMILARSTVRSAPALERESCSMVCVTSADIGGAHNATEHLDSRIPKCDTSYFADAPQSLLREMGRSVLAEGSPASRRSSAAVTAVVTTERVVKERSWRRPYLRTSQPGSVWLSFGIVRRPEGNPDALQAL